jgi:hypothetical protein
VANVASPSAADLLQLSGQLADDGTPPPAGPPAPAIPGGPTPPPVADDWLMRLRQFLTGVGAGAGGGAAGAMMSPSMLMSNLALQAMGKQPIATPTPTDVTKTVLDYAGLPSEPAKRDLLGNVLTATGATAGAPFLGAGLRTLSGELPAFTAANLPPRLFGAGIPAVTSGVGSGAALTGAEALFPNQPLIQEGASLLGGVIGGGPQLRTGPTPVSRAAEQEGVLGALTAADATGNPVIQLGQNVLRISPGGELAATKKARQALNINPSEPPGILPQRVDQVTDMPGVTVPSRENLGEHLATSADAAGERYLTELSQLKQRANTLLGNARVDVTPIQNWINAYRARAQQSGLQMNPDVFNPALEEAQSIVASADGNNTVSLQGLLDKRTSLGQRAFSRDPASEFNVPPTGQPGLVDLYGQVGNTLQNGAQAAAGPRGLAALQAVDDHVIGFRSPAPGQPSAATPPAQALKDYAKPGQGLNKLMSDIQGGDLTRLANLKSQLTPEEWNGVAASVWQNLWEPRPGSSQDVVSPASSLSNWNKITPAAKDILFGASSGTPQPIVPQTGATNFAPAGWRDAMDNLATVAGGMVETGRLGNPSRSALLGGSGAAAMAVLMPLMQGDFKRAAQMGAIIGGAYPAQRLLQSTPVVQALTNQLAGGAGYWPTTLQRLTLLANENPDLADAIKAYTGQVGAAMPAAARGGGGGP